MDFKMDHMGTTAEDGITDSECLDFETVTLWVGSGG